MHATLSLVALAASAGISSVRAAPIDNATPTLPSIAPPALCGNGGLQYAYYPGITVPVTDDDTGPAASFDPTVLKSRTPSTNGSTSYIRYSSASAPGVPAAVYSSAGALSSLNFGISHRGYIFAPETGTYTFTASNIDDYAFMWIGPSAYSYWSHSNVQQLATLRRDNTVKVPLQAGTFYPFRFAAFQGPGPASFAYNVTSPSGKLIVGSAPLPDVVSSPGTALNNLFVVQYSCDGVLAPKFAPFGQEL